MPDRAPCSSTNPSTGAVCRLYEGHEGSHRAPGVKDGEAVQESWGGRQPVMGAQDALQYGKPALTLTLDPQMQLRQVYPNPTPVLPVPTGELDDAITEFVTAIGAAAKHLVARLRLANREAALKHGAPDSDV